MTTHSVLTRHRFNPQQALFWLVGGVALLHLLAAGRVPLSADEAHYALYGLHLDWSYFDHPPLVGWLQALVLMFSQSELALRLWPIALSSASAVTLYFLTLRLFPQQGAWLGFWSVLLYESGILFQVLGFALLPETPLLLFALLSMLSLLRALDTGRSADWIWFGLCLGLAGLSKYTAITLAVSSLLFIFFQKRLGVLRTPGPWLALLCAAILIAPVLYWNGTHDWLSFRYQLGHGFRPKDWQWIRVVHSQLAQLFAYAPGIYVFGLLALIAGRHEWREPGVQMSLLWVVPVLLLFAAGSGREETLPHWTALAWAGVSPLTARWLLAHRHGRVLRAFGYFSAGYSVFMISLLHALLLVPNLPFPGKNHPLAPLQGWPDAAQQALRLRTELQATDPNAVLFVQNWSLASRLAWYARPAAVQVLDERFDQFDLWFGTPAPDASGILVVPENFHKSTPRVLGRFDSCEARVPLPVYAGERLISNFYFYVCRGYHGVRDPVP